MTTTSLPKKIFKVFAWVVGVLVVLALVLFTRVDRKDYHLEEYYLHTMGQLDTLNLHPTSGSTWLAGWSKVNATPQTPAKLLGYRPRGRYDFVEDSSFVRSLIVGNGRQKVAFVNYELRNAFSRRYGLFHRNAHPQWPGRIYSRAYGKVGAGEF